MPKRAKIDFIARATPITEPVTPFGGPPLCRVAGQGKTRVAKPCEYAAVLSLGEEPEWLDKDSLYEGERFDDEALAQYSDALEGNKLGDGPLFIQNDGFPAGCGWRLLLQLDSAQVPFALDFGDFGVGYAFIDEAGERGRFLWPCC